jgi:hypothetical protein
MPNELRVYARVYVYSDPDVFAVEMKCVFGGARDEGRINAAIFLEG